MSAKLTLRIKASRPASGDGCKLFLFRTDPTNRSISLPCPGGTADITGGSKAQCFWYDAPSLIHRLINSFSSSLSALCESGGGIISSSSFEIILSQDSLSSGFPGTNADFPRRFFRKASSGVSSRNLASRASSSIP